jgi:hypothetical protein
MEYLSIKAGLFPFVVTTYEEKNKKLTALAE